MVALSPDSAKSVLNKRSMPEVHSHAVLAPFPSAPHLLTMAPRRLPWRSILPPLGTSQVRLFATHAVHSIALNAEVRCCVSIPRPQGYAPMAPSPSPPAHRIESRCCRATRSS